MPQNTRVYRCVQKLRKKYGYSGAIGICQKATKQSYMTGRSLRKRKRTKRRRRRKRTKRYRRGRRTRRRKTYKKGGNGSSVSTASSSAAGPGSWIDELSTRGSTLTPSQPSGQSSSTKSSTESDWFFQGQQRPGDDMSGYGVGENIQLLHGCEVANQSCECILPWKTGICTYDKKNRRIYCKCQSTFQRATERKKTHHRRRIRK